MRADGRTPRRFIEGKSGPAKAAKHLQERTSRAISGVIRETNASVGRHGEVLHEPVHDGAQPGGDRRVTPAGMAGCAEPVHLASPHLHRKLAGGLAGAVVSEPGLWRAALCRVGPGEWSER